ncbi:hypothetical protein F2P56_018965 [Juglans regia]|uniref:Peptidyl-prolyl cis-trans isomerase n=1 Tax=Juglans regia TaxID=51240 RepID=A0A833UJQ3_JUGRE|nr:hypothetical protein F2P56_018965 [Juglans regia]
MSASTTTANQVRASHILIKHQGSRRKASWKDPEGQVIMNTTRESAVSQLKSLYDDIVSGKAKFEDIASRSSDCSSAKRGGDLGCVWLESKRDVGNSNVLKITAKRTIYKPRAEKTTVLLAGARCRSLLKKQHMLSRSVR